MKMKSSNIPENGVLTLYNQQLQAKVQVLYLTHVNKVAFIRVTDSKHISPMMIIMKIIDNFIVGDVILIKKVQLQTSGSLKEKEYQPFLDADVCHLMVLEYQVITSMKNMELIYQKANINENENYYLNSLVLVKNYLMKAEGMAETYFKELEKRVALLKDDCNLLRERGNELYKEHQYIKALLHYEMAKQKDHFDARVFNNCSQAYFCNKDYEKAKIEALIALKLDPFNKKGYYRASQALESIGDFKSAAEVVVAGLFMCGPSDDLEKLLRSIKDAELEQTKPNNKKKISNGDASEIINDFTAMNLTSSNTSNKKVPLVKAKDSPIRKSKEIELPKNDIKVDNNVSSNLSLLPSSDSVFSFLEGARMLYEKGKYKNAIELYVATTSKASNNLLSKQDAIIVKYLIEVCRILNGDESLEQVKDSLLTLLDEFPYPPAIHYWLAKIFERLEIQDKMVHHANSCILLTENYRYHLFWPGTKDPIQDTMPDKLKKWFSDGTWRPAPFAKCRHFDCISIQGHNLAKTEIYKSDLDFRGYVEVECEEMCSICYHPCCWKAIKEHNEDGQLGKKIDKDFLGMQCFTPDCCGMICGIRIFDENSHLRNEIYKDKKEKRNSNNTKLKKKKDKKKNSSQSSGRFDDKKKIKSADNDDVKSENEIEIVMEDVIFKTKESNCNAGVPNDPVNFEGSDYKILHPNDNDEEDFQAQINKKSKNKNKKKKKGKPAQINILTEEVLQEKNIHNDYLNRLKALKFQQEALENECVQSSSSGNNNSKLKFLPDCVLDPDKPFYLPKHLQENPTQLENILRAKMVTSTSSDIEAESVVTLLEFVYDWLKTQGPMSINDTRVRDYISENFPPNAVTYVNKCGGIKNFLLQSFRFAIIDDIICVSEQVVTAQELTVQNCLDKFKSNKYLISDGVKAVKLSHLLDETKSSCSTNSSQSNYLYHTDSSLCPSKTDFSSSATPYKAAAMASVSTPSQVSQSKEADKSIDYISKLIRPKPQPTQIEFNPLTKKSKESTPKKPKLKTMDIDAFEVIECGEMGQLFSPLKPIQQINDKPLGKYANSIELGDMMFLSDEEMEDDMLSIRNKLNVSKLRQPNVSELKEKINSLEAQLGNYAEKLKKSAEEKELLAIQNQELNDRLSQIKMKSNVEISALKKCKEDALELTKKAETNFESYKNQKEGELRKLLSEKSKHNEEIKASALKIDSLQLTIDQLNSCKNNYEEDLKQKSILLADLQMKYMDYEDTINNLDKRTKEAELKYISMKKELMTLFIEKTRKRLTAELNKMKELLLETTEGTHPTKNSILKAISEWDENVVKLRNSYLAITEDGRRYMDYIHSGRPLSSFPPGDLQLPTIPDLSVAKFLFVGVPITPKFNEPPISTNSSLSGLFSSSEFRRPSVGLGGVGSFSFGQLGVGATPRENEGGLIGLHSSKMDVTQPSRPSDILMGHRNAFGNSEGPSRLRESSLGTGVNHLLNDGLGLRSPIGIGGKGIGGDLSLGGLSSRMPEVGSRLGENPLDMIGNNRIMEGLRSTPMMNDPSSSLLMNGASSLSNLMGDDHTKKSSLESSPIPMPPFSASASDSPSTFSLGSKLSNSDANQLFVGQLPWNFTEEHLKNVFSVYGEVVAAAIHNRGHTNEGKPVPKCGFVTYRTQQERDYALSASAGTINFGNHALNIQAKDVKRGKLHPTSTLAAPDLPHVPPSSTPNMPAATTGSSAFGLQSLLDESKRITPFRNVPTSSTPTGSKPKFQHLKSNVSIGAIGSLPPKVVRPIPRTGTSNVFGFGGLNASGLKEDSISSSQSYLRLKDECKQKFGNEYSEATIHKAIKDVREHNKNSLSGLALETILDQVEVQLRAHKKPPPIAPWAQISKESPGTEWKGKKFDSISEDDCSICMERLSANATMPLQCGHVFHITCIKHWLSQKSDCPICRKFALSNDDYPPINSGVRG